MSATGTRYPLSQLGKPLQHSLNDLKNMNISDEILHLTAADAGKVRFSNWGPKEAYKAICKAGVLDRFISDAWVENHYRWIVWKLACMIRSYPSKFRDWWCSRKVVEQLLYRYEREINLGHQSVLKRIHEQDDNPAKHMVLAVADIKPFVAADGGGQAAAAVARKYQLVLTDGWYQINAVTDPRLERAIAKGKVSIGSKLSICGAQLNGDAQPRSPLSASSNDSILSITTNGSWLAAWDAKLGYQRNRLVLRSLSSVYEDGGIITVLDVVVCRKYPMMYTEVLPNGTRIKRTAREEEEERRRAGAELHQHWDDGGGGGWAPRFHEHGGMRMVQSRGKPLEEPSPTKPEERTVSAHFRVQLCDYRSNSNSSNSSDGGGSEQRMATLLLLDANELKHLDICEGSRYKIYFTMPYTLSDKSINNNSSTIHLKTTRKTQWESVSDIDEATLASTLYIPRQISLTATLPTLDKGSEIDIAVLVLHSTCSGEESRTIEGRALWYQTLLVTDASGGLCQVKLKLPCRPLKGIDGQIVGFTNVTREVHDTKYSITHLKVGDNSEAFNKQKAAPYMQQAINSVRQWAQTNPEELQAIKQRVNQFLL
ncbi:BRCA2, oligonucleotide/oligosaccharide-binding, domain 1-domain-containing protein [Zychaea mexicana]|uniref:BRCA2, oligonucleotide/oligosaccharide-binding, domain 1-domain-containing protein n=1 Tax=Zychaea mexicana TaxID=64656 RepID=UPI0022FEC978|nr:BRCA2, oligonucleotide/oligosaccharide-binding, domain 1-domain-containing protein [Zychaea mexicana]KAI9494923.1 BRCA2, oligonucleotide/oligosaccharide-binding, domain 1-domain-containing protein [Zychaea mexicana]